VGWKRARKICEKHWRRSENNCWGRDGTSAVIAVPSLTALSTTVSRQSAPHRRPVEKRHSQCRLRFQRRAKYHKPTRSRSPPSPNGRASVHTISAVRSSRRSACRRIDSTRTVPPNAPNQLWRTLRHRSSPSELPWSSARPLLSRRRQGARALLDRQPRCAEFSAPAHQL
jgi:hypothetical protein